MDSITEVFYHLNKILIATKHIADNNFVHFAHFVCNIVQTSQLHFCDLLPNSPEQHIGGGASWAGRVTAVHFSVLVGRAYSLPAHFFVVENLIFFIIQQRHGHNTKYSQLILRKITKIVAEQRPIFCLKCIKCDVGSAPDPAGGA